MLWLFSLALATPAAWFLARHLYLEDRYPNWQEARIREGQPASYLAFLSFHGIPLWGDADFPDSMRPENLRLHLQITLTFLGLFAVFLPGIWLLLVVGLSRL